MSKTKRFSADERRAQILEIALDVFSEKGFSGARTKEIARRAGISETLIYQHFDTKEELYRASLNHLCSGHPMLDDISGPMARGDDAGLFQAMALHMLVHTREDPRIVRLHLFQVLDGQLGKFEERQAVEKDDPSEAMLADYIQRRMDQGVFAPGDARYAAKLFHYLAFMAVADRQLGLLGRPPAMNDADMAAALVETFLNGLVAR